MIEHAETKASRGGAVKSATTAARWVAPFAAGVPLFAAGIPLFAAGAA
jgi:hypothetical protein